MRQGAKSASRPEPRSAGTEMAEIMANDKAKSKIGKHDAGQLDRWHRNATKTRIGKGAAPGNRNSLVHGIYADRFLSPEERPLFETIITQLSGDWDAAEKLDRMIRCHLKDLKATKIAREGETAKGPETTPAEWATALLEKLVESQKKPAKKTAKRKKTRK